MTGQPIVSWFPDFTQIGRPLSQLLGSRVTGPRHTLHYWRQHQAALPAFVRQSSVAMRCVQLLGPLAWDQFSERILQPHWHQARVPHGLFGAVRKRQDNSNGEGLRPGRRRTTCLSGI